MSAESLVHRAMAVATGVDRSTQPVPTRVCRGQHQGQVQLAVSVAPAQRIERHALKGVARSNDRYLVGKVGEVVGSLSSGLSTRSVMNG